jgi:subtilase family serine protease
LTTSSIVPNISVVTPGGSLVVSDTVSNTSAIGAGAFTIEYRLSANTTYGDADDVVVGSRTVSMLAAGSDSTATTSVSVPAATLLGTYFVCVSADTDNAVVEMSESNNALCSGPIQLARPDLTVSSVVAALSAIAPGDTLSVTDSVTNAGAIDASGFAVSFVLSANTVVGDADDVVLAAARTVAWLAAGTFNAASTAVTIPATASGTYYVCAVADSANAVAETNEANNGLCSGAIVVGLPDLAVTSIVPAVSSAAAGDVVAITDTAFNSGALRAGSFVISYRLSSNDVVGDADDIVIAESRSVASLGPATDDTSAITVTVPSATLPGLYFVCAIVDSGGAVAEGNESNNVTCSAVAVTVIGS